jgi:hypothetical protein
MMFLLACVQPEPCPAGSARRDDGLCYAETTFAAEAGAGDLLASLPACTHTEGDGRLDLFGGCADSGCAGDSYATLGSIYGVPGDCTSWGWTETHPDVVASSCAWDNGVAGRFPAVPSGDVYVPDPDAAGLRFWVDESWTGSTVDGLGPDAELSCFLDVLGPGSVSFEDGRPYMATWGTPAIAVFWSGDKVNFLDLQEGLR